ncbi:MAG: LysR substrate-binding domain-containing protein [Betaproteobacteria bacterium]|jgi:LysR family hydrogen peroxide-inducible transcriptional activator|nr:LysR family transcriptional regulator [Rhodocyclaceae bacterium]MCA3134641.1 LysR family transcriptional regulator [Rhodocyclaceae bacterium]MCA3143107.1 LysR family transcriptional regulator [Rhodocyclaceae bacterium]MCA3144535.1 LysR family transcriptional regulator [Rhodocyclaceae bacterium]MCE2898140.1 LysR substrate-binding domain-containing protein [Betaproteobacteria bacterium]
MTLQELKYVVAVAETRNFRRAAERVFVSQPSLSASVKKLEDELGVRLFERGPREVLLTEAGEQVVAQARRVLDEAARVREVARHGRDPLRGVLRLGVIHTIAPYLLPGLVLALRGAAPAMPLEIEENMTASLDQMLRGGLMDVAILALPYEAPGVEVLPLYDEVFRVVVPARHPWARRRAVKAEELAGENLLLLSIGHCFREQVMEACGEFARPAPPGRQGNSLETIRNMVASGLGVSVLPATALTGRHASPLVRAVDFAAPAPMRRVVAAFRADFPRRAAVQAMARAVSRLDLPVNPS